MPRKKITFDTVREMGLALPDVEEGTAYGSLALKVRGKMFACVAINKSAEPNSLVIRIGFDQRDELIAADPNTYYLTPHYVNYPVMLVRLTRGRVARLAADGVALRLDQRQARSCTAAPIGRRRKPASRSGMPCQRPQDSECPR